MRKVLLVFVLLSVVSGAKGQQDISTTLKSQAEEMVKHLLAKNFKEFVTFNHPKVIEMMGGDEKMIQSLDTGFKDLEKQGVKFLSIQIGEPSEIVQLDNELQAVVPVKLKMQTGENVIISESSLIAFSFKAGKEWKFVDSNGKTNSEVKSIFPSLSEKLIIPEKKEYPMKL